MFLKKHRTLKNLCAWKFNKLHTAKTEKQQKLYGYC